MALKFEKDLQYYKFCSYGFLKNLRFFEPFLILFFLEKGLTYFQTGILYSIREITTNILEIPTGIIADTLGRRKTMISAFISYIISFIIFYFSSSYVLFIIAMIFFSFGEAFRTGTHKAMIFEYLKIKGWEDQKVHYYGHTRSSSQMGSAISSILAAIIVFYSGSYKYIFICSAVPYIIDLFLMISYPPELDGELKKFQGSKIKESFKTVIKECIYSFKNPYVLKAIGNLSIYGGFYKAVKDFLQPVIKTFALTLPVLLFLEKKQKEAVIIGIFYFIIYSLTSYASKNSGRIADRFKKISLPLNTTMVIGFITGILIGIFYNMKITALSILFFTGIYIIENLRKPMGISYVTDLLDKNILATVLSVESQVKSLSAAIIAPLIGIFTDNYGLGYAIIIVSFILILSTPFYFVKEKEGNKAQVH